jgi:DNA-binding response OmpR family regulator
MNQPSLLIVDDDQEFLNSQALALKSYFKIIPSDTVKGSLQILQSEPIDCILADYYLGDGSGHDIASWVALHQPWCPVVLISARVDKGMALRSFAYCIFDILEKPYEVDHAVSRLKDGISVQSRRHNKESKPRWYLDMERRIFHFQGEAVGLTQTETKILQTLIEAKGSVMSRDQLVQALWGNSIVADNSLDTHLTNLRKKAPFLKTLLKGVRGVGYVLEI